VPNAKLEKKDTMVFFQVRHIHVLIVWPVVSMWLHEVRRAICAHEENTFNRPVKPVVSIALPASTTLMEEVT
jgi:hypothetical protein